MTDIRADVLETLSSDLPENYTEIYESADNDNAIIFMNADGNLYKLTIEKL